MTRACANCEFWHATDSVLQGECRRHAPRMTSDTGGWFHTQSTDWCGEHAQKGGKARPLSTRDLTMRAEPLEWCAVSHTLGADC